MFCHFLRETGAAHSILPDSKPIILPFLLQKRDDPDHFAMQRKAYHILIEGIPLYKRDFPLQYPPSAVLPPSHTDPERYTDVLRIRCIAHKWDKSKLP